MLKGKITMVSVLALAVLLTSFTGCAGKKKAPVQQVIKEPEKKPAPEPLIQKPPKKTEEKLTPPSDIRFNTIFFNFDKSNIRSDQRSILNSNAELLDKYETIKILMAKRDLNKGDAGANATIDQQIKMLEMVAKIPQPMRPTVVKLGKRLMSSIEGVM